MRVVGRATTGRKRGILLLASGFFKPQKSVSSLSLCISPPLSAAPLSLLHIASQFSLSLTASDLDYLAFDRTTRTTPPLLAREQSHPRAAARSNNENLIVVPRQTACKECSRADVCGSLEISGMARILARMGLKISKDGDQTALFTHDCHEK